MSLSIILNHERISNHCLLCSKVMETAPPIPHHTTKTIPIPNLIFTKTVPNPLIQANTISNSYIYIDKKYELTKWF